MKKKAFLSFLADMKEDFIKSASNVYLKELMIFFADEQANLKLEEKYYGTSYGGDKFYKNIDSLMEENNLEMLELYLLAMKIGFIGRSKSYNNSYSEKVEKLFEPLNLQIEKKNFNSMGINLIGRLKFVIAFLLLVMLLIISYYFGKFLIIANFLRKYI